MPPVRDGTAASLLSDASLRREELSALPAEFARGPSLETPPASAAEPVITIPSATAPSAPPRPAWKTVDGVSFLSDAAVSGGGATGQFGVFEYNAAQCRPAGSAVTSEFNYRSWSGPSHPNLPSNVFRLAWDFQLASEAVEPYGFEVGFTPALVTDFDAPVRSDAFNWDGRAALILRPASDLAITLGVAYWDRVNDLFIP